MLGNVLGSKNAIISHSVIIPHLFILAFCVACLDAVALSVMVTCLLANLGVFAVSPKVSSVCFCGVPYIFFSLKLNPNRSPHCSVTPDDAIHKNRTNPALIAQAGALGRLD